LACAIAARVYRYRQCRRSLCQRRRDSLTSVNKNMPEAIDGTRREMSASKISLVPKNVNRLPNLTPAAFAETIRTDLDKWSKIVKEANITLD
jgi:hypothetical protein